MPPRFIERKVENIIFYYYAKLVIAASAGLRNNYGFIIDTYKKLVSKELLISDYEREIEHVSEKQDICVFCGAKAPNLKIVHIVPKCFAIPPGVHNLVYACSACADSKGEKDLVDWWCHELGRPKDEIPRIPIGIYLKVAYELNKINFSLKKPCNGLGEVYKYIRKI